MRPSFRPRPVCALPRRTLARWAPVLAAAALAGCPDGNGGTPDGGEPVAALLPCSTDAECASLGFVCDPIRRTCVCVKDAMCQGNPGGPYCNAFTGRCEKTVAGCKGDSDCGAGMFCDPALRACRARRGWCDTCTLDEECGGPGDFCIIHPDFPSSPRFCGEACGAGDTCTNGVCATTEKGRQCIPAVGRCSGSTTCIPDTGQACSDEEDCTQGTNQTCELGAGTTGRCIAKQRTCQSGQACDPVTRQCVNACVRDSECEERLGPGHICKNMVCVPAAMCEADADCPNVLQWCFKDPVVPEAPGQCQATCTADAQCPMGQRCVRDIQAGRQRCVDGCSTNADCPLDAVCDGTCQHTTPAGAQRCQVKEVCDFRQFCQNQTCVAVADHCKPCTGGCGAGTCETFYYTPVCDNLVCSRDADCKSADTFCQLSTPTTGRCRPRCSPDPMRNLGASNICPPFVNTYACERTGCLYSCTNANQCPKGFDCTNFGLANYCFPYDSWLARQCRPTP